MSKVNKVVSPAPDGQRPDSVTVFGGKTLQFNSHHETLREALKTKQNFQSRRPNMAVAVVRFDPPVDQLAFPERDAEYGVYVESVREPGGRVKAPFDIFGER